jgi:cell wall-associated NlpC family hydrolase
MKSSSAFAVAVIIAFGTTLVHAADLLEEREGEQILAAAWQYQETLRRKPDCSRLVHQIYRAAGYEYDYAPSNTLYSGTAPFRRVADPQPGDLIVWRGHVGLVVDPDKGTFYSSQRTGLITSSYETRYWKGRGTPRFLRYDKSSPAASVDRVQVAQRSGAQKRANKGRKIARSVFSLLGATIKVVRAR